MKNLFILTFGLLVILGCEKDPAIQTGSNVQFKMSYQGSNVAVNDVITDAEGRPFIVEEIKFYIDEFKIKAEDGAVLHEQPLMLIDLSNNQSFDLPELTGANSIDFKVRVNPTENSSDPNSYPLDDPLSFNKGMYWDMSGKYRFIILEGRLDSDNDGSYETLMAYHLGLDEFAAEVQNLNFSSANTIEIKLDLRDLFDGPNTIDMAVENETHTLNNRELALKLKQNLELAWSVNAQ